MVTKKDIFKTFVNSIYVQQYGRKQLFRVVTESLNGTREVYIVSYKTIIAKSGADGVWEITDKQYSPTTIKHINYFISNLYPHSYRFVSYPL